MADQIKLHGVSLYQTEQDQAQFVVDAEQPGRASPRPAVPRPLGHPMLTRRQSKVRARAGLCRVPCCTPGENRHSGGWRPPVCRRD